MKRITLIAIAWTLALAGAGCSASRSAVMSEADIITARQIGEMLDGHLYKFDFDRAYPMSAPSFPLSSRYYISVIGDRVESFLPYFGRAYTARYGGGEGLRFAASVSEYSERVTKKGVREITFKANTDEDFYEFILTVYPLGECNLSVIPGQKQQISFSGEIDLEPEFEAVRVE